jgi:catechol 2,3-dioxygenase-like lactoylglutathione lyase family enzyme
MPLLDLHHVAIKSKDLKATEKFYTKVLGMKKVARPDFPFPGIWLEMGETMFHIYGGNAAKTYQGDYKYDPSRAPVDHVALRAKGFDKMKEVCKKHRCTWRQNDIKDFKLWQLFVLDPSGVIIELNFDATKEPRGSKGPTARNQFDAGRPFA